MRWAISTCAPSRSRRASSNTPALPITSPDEGFYPKAAALYKKILKIKPDDEYSMLQSGDLAAKQGTLADAKQFFLQVAERRKARGDRKGAAEVAIRLGTLDPEDLDARLRAGQLAAEMGDTAIALREFREVAAQAREAGPPRRRAGAAAARLRPRPVRRCRSAARLFAAYLGSNPEAARKVASGIAELKEVAAALREGGPGRCGARRHGRGRRPRSVRTSTSARTWRSRMSSRGDLDKARTYLSAETAGSNPALWLTLAEMELRANRFPEGKAAVVQALSLDREQAQTAVVLGCRLAESNAEAGYQPIDAVADAALAEGDYTAAAVALHEFTTRVRSHLVALMRLVEICVDGDLEGTMYEAQAALADAYLDAGRAMEARIISEDLVAREPWNRVNIDRFRRALVMLGEGDPDAIIADRLSGDSPFLATEKMDLNEGVSFDTPPAPAPCHRRPASRRPRPLPVPRRCRRRRLRIRAMEIDLTDLLAEPAPEAAVDAAPLPLVPPPPRSLDQVFRGMRDESNRASSEEAAAEQYRLALTYHEMGMVEDAIKALEAAARSPRQRFDSASMLGRLYLERKDTDPRDRVARARRRSAGANPRCRPRACSTIWPRRWNRWASSRAPSRSSSSSSPNRAAIATWPARSNGCPRCRREASVCSGGCCSLPCCSNQGCSWC